MYLQTLSPHFLSGERPNIRVQHYPWFEFEKEVAVDLEDKLSVCSCPEQSLFRDTMFGRYIYR